MKKNPAYLKVIKINNIRIKMQCQKTQIQKTSKYNLNILKIWKKALINYKSNMNTSDSQKIIRKKKSSLFRLIKSQKYLPTQTSFKNNIDVYKMPCKIFSFMDIFSLLMKKHFFKNSYKSFCCSHPSTCLTLKMNISFLIL